MVDTPASKAGARRGVRVRVPRLVLGGSETVKYECVCARVVADIGVCSSVVGAARGALVSYVLADGARVLVARIACALCLLFCFPCFGQ